MGTSFDDLRLKGGIFVQAGRAEGDDIQRGGPDRGTTRGDRPGWEDQAHPSVLQEVSCSFSIFQAEIQEEHIIHKSKIDKYWQQLNGKIGFSLMFSLITPITVVFLKCS